MPDPKQPEFPFSPGLSPWILAPPSGAALEEQKRRKAQEEIDRQRYNKEMQEIHSMVERFDAPIIEEFKGMPASLPGASNYWDELQNLETIMPGVTRDAITKRRQSLAGSMEGEALPFPMRYDIQVTGKDGSTQVFEGRPYALTVEQARSDVEKLKAQLEETDPGSVEELRIVNATSIIDDDKRLEAWRQSQRSSREKAAEFGVDLGTMALTERWTRPLVQSGLNRMFPRLAQSAGRVGQAGRRGGLPGLAAAGAMAGMESMIYGLQAAAVEKTLNEVVYKNIGMMPAEVDVMKDGGLYGLYMGAGTALQYTLGRIIRRGASPVIEKMSSPYGPTGELVTKKNILGKEVPDPIGAMRQRIALSQKLLGRSPDVSAALDNESVKVGSEYLSRSILGRGYFKGLFGQMRRFLDEKVIRNIPGVADWNPRGVSEYKTTKQLVEAILGPENTKRAGWELLRFDKGRPLGGYSRVMKRVQDGLDAIEKPLDNMGYMVNWDNTKKALVDILEDQTIGEDATGRFLRKFFRDKNVMKMLPGTIQRALKKGGKHQISGNELVQLISEGGLDDVPITWETLRALQRDESGLITASVKEGKTTGHLAGKLREAMGKDLYGGLKAAEKTGIVREGVAEQWMRHRDAWFVLRMDWEEALEGLEKAFLKGKKKAGDKLFNMALEEDHAFERVMSYVKESNLEPGIVESFFVKRLFYNTNGKMRTMPEIRDMIYKVDPENFARIFPNVQNGQKFAEDLADVINMMENSGLAPQVNPLVAKTETSDIVKAMLGLVGGGALAGAGAGPGIAANSSKRDDPNKASWALAGGAVGALFMAGLTNRSAKLLTSENTVAWLAGFSKMNPNGWIPHLGRAYRLIEKDFKDDPEGQAAVYDMVNAMTDMIEGGILGTYLELAKDGFREMPELRRQIELRRARREAGNPLMGERALQMMGQSPNGIIARPPIVDEQE